MKPNATNINSQEEGFPDFIQQSFPQVSAKEWPAKSFAPNGQPLNEHFSPLKKLLLTLFFFFISFWIMAQDTTVAQVEREPTGLRAYEKVYVVVAVLTTILAGLFIYIIRLDRKISKLEKE